MFYYHQNTKLGIVTFGPTEMVENVMVIMGCFCEEEEGDVGGLELVLLLLLLLLERRRR